MRTLSSLLSKIGTMLVWGVLLFPAAVLSQPIGAPVEQTLDDFDKSNQSKVFYHAGTWWLTARSIEQTWYLWKQVDNTWVKTIALDTSSKTRPDCYVDSQKNKLYIVLSHTSSSRFLVAYYENDAWLVPADYPVEIEDFSHSDDNVVSLTVDHSGTIWLFRIDEGVFETVYSTDDGKTWSDFLPIKLDLNTPGGLTDAVAFTEQGEHFVGVAHAENTVSGAISQFGFFVHKITDPPTSWTDETGPMGQFPSTSADNHVSAIAGADGTVYIIVKTSGGSLSAAENGLYIRKGESWRRVTVNSQVSWTRPALALDETNNEIYAFGTLESSPKLGLYKKAPIGSEEALQFAPDNVVFQNGEDDFSNISLPPHRVNEQTGLMVTVENKVQENIWASFLEISKPTSVAEQSAGPAPRDFEMFAVFPNPLRQQALTAGTEIKAQIALSDRRAASVHIYNILGQRIATISENLFAQQGFVHVNWNGEDAFGRLVPPGVYFMQAKTATQSATRKILILR